MTRKYKVAEHVFALTMTDSCSLWPLLAQYEPFEVDTAEDPIFSLELCKSIPEGPRQVVYDAPAEDGQTVVRLFSQGQDWYVEMAPEPSRPISAMLWASKEYKQGKLMIATRKVSDAIFGINNSLMLLFAFNTATLSTLELHASMVSNNGKAFLFLAKSGTGKSTHTGLWLKHVPGTELMNDDNPIVRIWPDGRVIAYGSPWSGKTPCYKNVEAPVGAFVRIRRSRDNKITPLKLVESYALVYSSSSGFKADGTMGAGLHSSLEKAVTSVPCYVLDCRPDEEAALVCSRELLSL